MWQNGIIFATAAMDAGGINFSLKWLVNRCRKGRVSQPNNKYFWSFKYLRGCYTVLVLKKLEMIAFNF